MCNLPRLAADWVILAVMGCGHGWGEGQRDCRMPYDEGVNTPSEAST